MNKEHVLLALAVLTAISIYIFPSNLNTFDADFKDFKQTYNRQYSPSEEIYRRSVFLANLAKITTHNADSTQTYKMGVNDFTDMTQQEFVDKILINDLINKAFYQHGPKIVAEGIEAPSEVDWRQKDVLTAVKNQGRCGSCWAFSTTGTLESALAVAGKSLYSFSEQQLVDCCGPKGFQCQGCNGAWPEWAFNYINSAGIVLENEYSYAGVQGACKSIPTAKKFLNSGKPWSFVSGLDSIKETLASRGPISICVDATNWSAYRSGVFSNCGTTVLNHAVTLVGYQSAGAWIVRNSWGATWGDNGFIYLGSGNTCGLGEHAIIPNLA